MNFDMANDRTASAQQRNQMAPMTVDQQLGLMNTINTMVKNGQFTVQLATTVFQLCAQLKTTGVLLEQTHKNDLNRVFVSLRQACCRDNGQLGTPCRLKIMELVELRAMNWRSNLAHSQYYVNRPEQQQAEVHSSLPSPFLPQQNNNMYMGGHNDMSANQVQSQPNPSANHGFYLIPATGGWMSPLIPGVPGVPGMMSGNPFMPHQSPIMPHEHVLMRQRSLKKPSLPKTMQLRHEMIIRNSDSGKIMGVKGRRVALVEQITNTVISFQKVDPKSKERTLTITANTAEDIERAKDLIIETIRRNMSPCRADPSGGDMKASELEDEDDNDISIETTQDGMLKLCCSDPEVLQAAQAALSEYLRVRARPSAEEREKKKERRKSMPLQQNNNPEPTLKTSRSFHGSTPNLADGLPSTTLVPVPTPTTGGN